MMSSYVAPLARETAEEISKILNNQTVQSGSLSTGGHGSKTVQMMAKPFMSPDDIINMEIGNFIVMKSGCRPMKTKLRYYKDYFPEFDGYIRTQRNEARVIDKMTIDDVLMPLTLQIHHAVADGYHCSLFYNDVEQTLINPEMYLK